MEPSGLVPSELMGGVPIAVIPAGRAVCLNPSRVDVGILGGGGFLFSTIVLMSSTSKVSYFNKASEI